MNDRLLNIFNSIGKTFSPLKPLITVPFNIISSPFKASSRWLDKKILGNLQHSQEFLASKYNATIPELNKNIETLSDKLGVLPSQSTGTTHTLKV